MGGTNVKRDLMGIKAYSIVDRMFLYQRRIVTGKLGGRMMKRYYISHPFTWNEQQPTLPIGWSNGYNKDFHCCPDCSKRIAKEVGEP